MAVNNGVWTMPMLFWLPMIIFGGMLNVTLDAASGTRERSAPPFSPFDELMAERIARQFSTSMSAKPPHGA
jgi:hypothetical protein